MRRSLLKLSTLLFIPFLTACNGTYVVEEHLTSFMSVRNETPTAISFSCQKSDGYIIYSINIKNGQSLDVQGNATVNGGRIAFKAYLPDESTPYYENALEETTDFTIFFKEYGRYRIRVDMDEFKGSYKLSWVNKA